MRLSKKILTLCVTSVMALSVMTTSAATDSVVTSDQAVAKVANKAQVNRAKVVHISVELELPDGERITVDNIDLCTPDSFYNGVQALVFGDEAVKVMQAGMAALYPKVGDSVYQMWNNKVNPDDPRLPTFLMIKPPESNQHKLKGGASRSSFRGVLRSSAKVLGVEDAPVLMATCGGYNHPDVR